MPAHMKTVGLSFAILLVSVFGQQIGDVREIHPAFLTKHCSKVNGCDTLKTKLVLDATWRDVLDIRTGTSCLTNDLRLNKTFCATKQACAENCALQGADYAGTGVLARHYDRVELQMYQKFRGELMYATAVGPQVYLLDPDGKDYQVLHLLNQEISFDLDVSKAPCGIDTAVYLTSMSPSGGRSPLNPAGASYGTGYCDSTCYSDYAFIDGIANIDHRGACCNEMDLWEGNKFATQMTAHPCTFSHPGVHDCNGKECGPGRQSWCDSVGCGFNPYGLGHHSFYGSGAKVNTNKPFRVVTQFLTDDHTVNGDLVEIRRLYIQDGRILLNANVSLGHDSYNSISTTYCKSIHAKSFAHHGALKQMGEALRNGMVLVMGVWELDSGWLDSSNEGAGPCSAKDDRPRQIRKKHPHTSFTTSDLAWGDIGTTCSNG